VCLHRNGCKLLLYLLAPEATAYLDPEELKLLEPAMVPATGTAAAATAGDAAEPVMVCTSRKVMQ
jgi:hypothetical protein